MEYIRLRNNIEVSAIGLGTYPMKPHHILRVIPHVSEFGINLIDTAYDYKNESWLGFANKLKRDQKLLFSTKMSVGQQREQMLRGGIQNKHFYKA